ncbi:hypothetical protein MUP77_16345 [Candidatus Bathyarchaeota archaeon]|nr:hypothetical protein [Candidatus Bathyarchaeota archaeon]
MFRPKQQPTRRDICPECKGQGKVMNNDLMNWGWKPCQACNGTGFIEYATPQPRLNQTQRKPFSFRGP